MSAMNPAAFPSKSKVPIRQALHGGATTEDHHEPGMTLRDYFAAAALTGLMARAVPGTDVSRTARVAYALADDMLAERAKGGPDAS